MTLKEAGRTLPPRKDALQAADGAMINPQMRRILRPGAVQSWLLPQLSAITPTYIEMILRGSFQGSTVNTWQLFDLMEDTWPRLVKNLNESKQAVLSMQWTTKPWAEDDAPATPEAEERAKQVSNAV